MNIPSRTSKSGLRKNPITSDSALTRLLEQAKNFQSEDEFKGWKESFLEVYTTYLDPAGVKNAHASDDRLVRSLEKLASTVVSVNALVDDGKITTGSQTVMGKRALTNMTDQMAKTEQEIQRFMPTTAADEAVVGYDKWELAAVMIEDGFHVYELLKTTRSITRQLQETVLNEVLPNNKISIIQFYLRQIQSFCDVMADLGLFGLMEDVMDLYKIKPRSRETPKAEPQRRMAVPAPKKVVPPQEPEESQVVELDPDKVYHFRSSFEGGYKDPFSGTAPGSGEEPLMDQDSKDDQKGEGGEEDFIVYFDIKTGCIGKIPRHACAAKGMIVLEGNGGEETLQGEIEDPDEKEELVWALKKAMKGGGGKTKSSGAFTKSPGAKSYVMTPRKDAKRLIGRSKSGDSQGSQFRGLAAPQLDLGSDEDNDAGVQNGGTTMEGKAKLSGKAPPRKSSSIDPSIYGKQSIDQERDNEGGNKKPTTKPLTISTTTNSSSSTTSKNGPFTKTPNRSSSQKVAKNPKPSSGGWANASSMAAARRSKSES